jgi:hypothetical protein
MKLSNYWIEKAENARKNAVRSKDEAKHDVWAAEAAAFEQAARMQHLFELNLEEFAKRLTPALQVDLLAIVGASRPSAAPSSRGINHLDR